MSERDPTVGLVVPIRPTTTGSGEDHKHDDLGRFGGCSECQSHLRGAPDAPQSPPRRDHADDASIRRCVFCGDGAVVEGLSWTFAIKRPIAGLNERRTNSGATRFAYADERREWGWELEVMRRRYEIPAATGPRRVVIIRYIAAPNGFLKQRGRRTAKLMDYGNLVGGCKPLVDALVKTKLLVDDDPANLRDHYRQVISDFADDFDKVEITITDLVIP